jgi:hypothetical protein
MSDCLGRIVKNTASLGIDLEATKPQLAARDPGPGTLFLEVETAVA